MAFCIFSKDVDNSYTVVENKFITKYLPESDGFAVKVYLYGLYLCKNTESDFTLASMAEVLKTSEETIVNAFLYWEDYDLIEVLSRDPFTVQYLPVKASVGKPKKIRYEQYAAFNKELQRKMQKVGKFVSANDYLKYMHFLEESEMQPPALLLIVEYCIRKQGEAVSPAYIFNKAKKMQRNGLSTYEQVERELSDYNEHENDLLAVYNALSLDRRTPDDADYALYKKWTETLGFSKNAVLLVAKKLKRASMNALDLTLEELAEKGKLDEKEVDVYLTERETLTNLAFRIGRKLGVKVQNPTPYVDEYVRIWHDYGFEETSLLDLALFCMKSERGDFNSMHALVQTLFTNGCVSKESVKNYLKARNEELKLFTKIQELCGTIRKSANQLSLVQTWRDWNFNDDMILEAARRSANSASPIPYMNKILSEWKRMGIFKIADLSKEEGTKPVLGNIYTNQAAKDADAKADRERYYAKLREKAQTRAEKYLAKANANLRFKEITGELSKMEFALAKAEMYDKEQYPILQSQKERLLAERKQILQQLGIDEASLLPQFECKKCSDTGFLPNGTACTCYKG